MPVFYSVYAPRIHARLFFSHFSCICQKKAVILRQNWRKHEKKSTINIYKYSFYENKNPMDGDAGGDAMPPHDDSATNAGE
jgi:hypothetical protein